MTNPIITVLYGVKSRHIHRLLIMKSFLLRELIIPDIAKEITKLLTVMFNKSFAKIQPMNVKVDEGQYIGTILDTFTVSNRVATSMRYHRPEVPKQIEEEMMTMFYKPKLNCVKSGFDFCISYGVFIKDEDYLWEYDFYANDLEVSLDIVDSKYYKGTFLNICLGYSYESNEVLFDNKLYENPPDLLGEIKKAEVCFGLKFNILSCPMFAIFLV